MKSYYENSSVTPHRQFNTYKTDRNFNQCCHTPKIPHSPMIHQNTSKHTFISGNSQNDLNNKSISFSQESPKRYTIPDSFKTPPSPNKFRDSNSPRFSSILRKKPMNLTYEKQIMCTPSSSFRNAFNEKAQGSISPLINKYACFDSNKTNSNEPINSSNQSCTIISSFIITSCIVTLVLICM